MFDKFQTNLESLIYETNIHLYLFFRFKHINKYLN